MLPFARRPAALLSDIYATSGMKIVLSGTDSLGSNIQHSLRNYQDGGHFRSLIDLYESDELTSAINRVVEEINHRFTLDVLSRDFRSHDLGVARTNLRKDRAHPQDVLDRVER